MAHKILGAGGDLEKGLAGTRRGFLTGLVGLVAAPAIVRIDALMPVRLWKPEVIQFVELGFSNAPPGGPFNIEPYNPDLVLTYVWKIDGKEVKRSTDPNDGPCLIPDRHAVGRDVSLELTFGRSDT